MSQHTPGPWKAIEVGNIIGVVPIGKSGDPRDGRSTEDVCALNKNGDCAAANAHLIAVAPDLLKACKVAADYFADTDAPIGAQLRAAIAKAEGGAT